MPRVVCDTAKVRFFKQITTVLQLLMSRDLLFVILQKNDLSSKSQHRANCRWKPLCCLWYCKSTIFQANHNSKTWLTFVLRLFVILQKYDFSSKSQLSWPCFYPSMGCLWYCKSTIFQANHNTMPRYTAWRAVVCDTAKVRFFKQITTNSNEEFCIAKLFVILQKYDFSSKSQLIWIILEIVPCCLWYCKSTIFQANHNGFARLRPCC